MTTEARPARSFRGERRTGSVLVPTAGVALVGGLVLVALGAVLGGSPAAYGALTGTLLMFFVFGAGFFAIDMISRLMPKYSMLVALVTFTAQVVGMLAVLSVMQSTDYLDGALDRRWLGGAILFGALLWMVAQILHTMRARIPIYYTVSENAESPSQQRIKAGT